MKNLNPFSGLRQITNGYVSIPRFFVIDLIRSKGITPTQLGWFLFFLIVADWDKDRYRNGYVRFSQADLALIWGVNPSTISKAKKELIKLNILKLERNCIKLNHFTKLFTSKGAQQHAKTPLSDTLIQVMFPELIDSGEIIHDIQIDVSDSFKRSNKGDLAVTSNDSNMSEDDKEWINNDLSKEK